MAGKKLKLADIAALAGVSKSTVSFVLNGHAKKHRIHEDTVEKVQAIAKQYHYKPSIYARALKSKQTYTVGLVIPDLANMGFANIAKRLEILCRNNGYQLLIASSDDDHEQEQQAVKSLIERQVDVLLVATCMMDDSFYQPISPSTPVIFFDRILEDSDFVNIKTNAEQATKEVVAHLALSGEECVYIGGQLNLSTSRDRFKGYQLGLKDAGVRFDDRYVYSKDYQPESGYELMALAVEDLGRLPKAVYTASYSLLEGVLRFLTEKNMLGEDIRLATFDNYDILDCLPVKIDSVEQDCELIAQTLFDYGQTILKQPEMKTGIRVLPARVCYRRKFDNNFCN